MLFRKETMNFLRRFDATGHRTDNEAGTARGIATHKDILRILRMLRLQESHSQQDKFGLDNLGLPLLDHQWTPAFWVGLPVDFLHFHAGQFAVLAEELEGVDVPTTGAALLVR